MDSEYVVGVISLHLITGVLVALALNLRLRLELRNVRGIGQNL
jgi:hypothetical protein